MLQSYSVCFCNPVCYSHILYAPVIFCMLL
jgi:hypothetical protein